MTPSLSIDALFQALGFTLLHFAWQGAIIAGLYWAVTRLMPKSRPGTRYVLGLSALLAMPGAALVTFGYELTRRALGDAPAGGARFIGPDLIATHATGPQLSHWLPLLDALWLVGVAVLSLRMASGLWVIRRLSAQAQDVPDAVRRRFEAALTRAGLSGRVRVRLNPHIDSPFVVGIIRAVVYLPLSAVTALTPDQLDAVLAHELEHVRRADYAWNLLQTVIETLFFYHPAVWWIGKTLREQRELCCDDVALTVCDDPLTYATALLSLEERRRAPRPGGDLVMALNGQGSARSLLSRISRVLGESTDKTVKKPGRSTALMPLAVPVVLLAAAAMLLPISHVAANPQTSTQATPETKTATQSVQTVATADDNASGADESPAPAATDADVAPDESTWNFVRDAAQNQGTRTGDAAAANAQTDANVRVIDAQAMARLAANARQEALAELQRHKAEIAQAMADARRTQDTARLEALKSIDMAKIQAEIQKATEEVRLDQAQIQREATLSEADRRKIEAEAQRAAAEARAEFGDNAKAWKDFGKTWAKSWTSGSVPPAPPAPAAPPAPPAPAAPPAPPAPAAIPAVAMTPIGPVTVKMVKVVMAKSAKPCKVPKPYKVDVKVSAKIDSKVILVDLKAPVVNLNTRVDIKPDMYTATE